MVNDIDIFHHLGPARILVIGDFLLDCYTYGVAQKISPEAPVPVVQVDRQEYRPGGAGNVVLNLYDLGAEVVMVGRVGNDLSGRLLQEGLILPRVHSEGMITEEGYLTPLKNRLIATHQQMIRIDHERIVPLALETEEEILFRLPQLLEDVALVAVSDYGKGTLTERLLERLYTLCQERGILTLTDPKENNFQKYAGTTLLKPNEKEAYAAAKLPPSDDIQQVAERLLAQPGIETLLVTRAEKGISLFERGGKRKDFPVQKREVVDVTGAGDTVLAVLAFALANDLALERAIPLANLAAGLAIEEVGCARIRLSAIARRLVDGNRALKFLSEENHSFFEKALENHAYIMIEIPGHEAVTARFLLALHTLAEKHPKEDLVALVTEGARAKEWIELLATLPDVQWITQEKRGGETLLKPFPPAALYNLGSFAETLSLHSRTETVSSVNTL